WPVLCRHGVVDDRDRKRSGTVAAGEVAAGPDRYTQRGEISGIDRIHQGEDRFGCVARLAAFDDDALVHTGPQRLVRGPRHTSDARERGNPLADPAIELLAPRLPVADLTRVRRHHRNRFRVVAKIDGERLLNVAE